MAFAKIESVNSVSIGKRVPLKFYYLDGTFLLGMGRSLFERFARTLR